MAGPGEFKDPGLTDELSYGGNMSNPITETELNGTAGDSREKVVYFANTDPAAKLTECHVECANGTAAAYYRYAPDVDGAPGAYAVGLDLAEIVGVGSHKVWTKLVVVPGTPYQVIASLRHHFSGKIVPV